MSDSTQLVRATGAMSLATFASRLLGLAREIVFAAFLGQTLVASAFYFAFTIPNLFRRLLGEGALTAAFIPLFKETLAREGVGDARRAANVVASVLFATCCLITVAAALLLSGWQLLFAESEKTRLILSLTRGMMPYMIFVCMAALAMAILNSRGHFFVPAFSPVLLNVVMIGSVFVFCPWLGTSLETQVYGLVAGVLLGGLIQWGYQLPLLWREGFGYRWEFRPRDPKVRRVANLMLPSVIGVAVFQVNVITSGALAFWVGDYVRAALNYADRLMELPMGLFGVSVATFALPSLSALAAAGKMDQFKSSLAEAVRLLWFLTIPAALGLMVLAKPIVRLLFERGRFDSTATEHAAFALVFLAPAMVSYATVNVLARAFYALHDTRTPMKIGVVAMITNVLLAFALMWPLKEGGLALANTLSSTFNAVALGAALRERIGTWGGRPLLNSAARTSVATLVMAAPVGALSWLWERQPPVAGWPTQWVLALGPIALGVAVFLTASVFLQSPELRAVRSALARRGRASRPSLS